ncbi:putative mitochondrial uncoupling protein 5-like [Capsicum annuum]|nr:putative mitochondrial uncoupling protein 5-like [Capsicum annuum]
MRVQDLSLVIGQDVVRREIIAHSTSYICRLWPFEKYRGCSIKTSDAPPYKATSIPIRMQHTPLSISQKLASTTPPVKLLISRNYVVMDNGIVKVTLTNPTGSVAGVSYNGIDNVLETNFKDTNRGYWDTVWERPGDKDHTFDMLLGTKFRVIAQDKNKVEVSFTKTWNPSINGTANDLPLNIDKRFVMLRGSSGFYSYGIFEHLKDWPSLILEEARIAIKLRRTLFHYMAISDDMQRMMPTDEDRSDGQVLDYKEAVRLTHPSNPKLKGEVDDKYQYSFENKDIKVHGWVCNTPHVGFWVITPSYEDRNGGPTKLDLTSHAGPTSLAVFFSGHYAGPELGVAIKNGESWKKVFGPVFFYLNSDSGDNHPTLWEDAKRQMQEETAKWPYDFPESVDYPHANQRGTVRGQLFVRDRYINNNPVYAKSAYIGLALPGDVGSWQYETKGYQFWIQTDETGHFSITDVRPGTYNLYSWVPGIIGDYKYNYDINVKQGSDINLGHLIYDPPRNGPTLWEIGIPDRTAAEFFVPDPLPGLTNQLFNNTTQKFRQYGLWDRYTDLYPYKDLVYKVGASDYRKDWFFAHVTRRTRSRNYIPTTWQISFKLPSVDPKGTYTLRIALASATYSHLQGRINNPSRPMPHFETPSTGRSNAIARHGIHGLYWLFNFQIQGLQLQKGENTIFLKQIKGGNPFYGHQYDYIRLEGPPQQN